jgi:hypothetical protein
MFLLEVVNRMLPYVENSSVIAVFCLLILLLSPRTQGEEILLMLFVVVSQVRHGLRFPDAGYLGRPGCGPNKTLFQLSSRACFAARVSSCSAWSSSSCSYLPPPCTVGSTRS